MKNRKHQYVTHFIVSIKHVCPNKRNDIVDAIVSVSANGISDFDSPAKSQKINRSYKTSSSKFRWSFQDKKQLKLYFFVILKIGEKIYIIYIIYITMWNSLKVGCKSTWHVTSCLGKNLISCKVSKT